MKRVHKILALGLCVLLLSSCLSEQKSCEDIALRLCDELKLPVGQMYCCGKEGTSLRELPSDTMSVMYGANAKDVFELIEEYSIYLCAAGAPYEVAVFKCYSSSDSDSVAALCLGRADALSVLLRGTEYADIARNSAVCVKGKYTVMVIAPDPEKAEEIAKGILR